MKKHIVSVLASLVVGSMPAMVVATNYPDRAISIVVPFGPDSATDTLARALSREMSKNLGVPVVIENKGGAAGTIGAQYAAAAKPDGYTLILGSNGPFAANVSLYKSLPYSPIDDFEPIVLAGYVPQLLLTSAQEKTINTLNDVIEKSINESNTVSFGATNTTSQIWAELLKREKDFDVPVVMYKDTGSLFIDIAERRVNFAFGSVAPARSMINAGKIKPIAITGDERMVELPDTPTLKESGFNTYSLDVWMAMFAPRGTPNEIIQKLNKAVNNALDAPEVQRISAHIGMAKVGGPTELLRKTVEQDVKAWKELVELTGVAVN